MGCSHKGWFSNIQLKTVGYIAGYMLDIEFKKFVLICFPVFLFSFIINMFTVLGSITYWDDNWVIQVSYWKLKFFVCIPSDWWFSKSKNQFSPLIEGSKKSQNQLWPLIRVPKTTKYWVKKPILNHWFFMRIASYWKHFKTWN